MLTEVIVALVILALGLTALFGSVQVSTRAAAIADRQRLAVVAAQSLLADIGISRPIGDGPSEGDFTSGQHWKLEIDKLPDGDNNHQPQPLEGYRVALTVTWQQNGQIRTLDFHTLVLKAAQ
jgi:Tfp pilus assembly protein PilV